MNQLEFEIAFLEAILRRSANYVDVLWILSSDLSAKEDYQRRLEIDRRLAALLPDNPKAQFNLACSMSRLGMIDAAFTSLDRAVELGHGLDECGDEHDLDRIRSDPRYSALLARVQH